MHLKKSRFNLIGFFFLIFACISLVTRLALMVWSFQQAELGFFEVGKVILIGFIFDCGFYSYFAIPFIVFLMILPSRILQSRFFYISSLIIFTSSTFLFLWTAIAEILFWDEFGTRFNFISVDYLIYYREVTDNIAQSYPVFWLTSGALLLSLIIGYRFRFIIRDALIAADREQISVRILGGFLLLATPIVSYFYLDQAILNHSSSNSYQQALAGSGPYQFFAAFRNNELDYKSFYVERSLPDVGKLIQDEINESTTSEFHNEPDQPINVARFIDNQGEEKQLNIVLIMVESLSAEYMGAFGNKENLTPNLDKLARQGLLFNNFYATGTRTTRGLEAVTLSLPPTPGQSIVKRIGRTRGLFSLGQALNNKGYASYFVYGGRGYFDNMNAFFSDNGYGIVDRASFADSEVKFENAWGIADEDLFNKVLNLGDASYEQKKPFFTHIMTTSNHRPFSYPENRIDIPSGSGRNGAVKYTDWAIGQFIEKAKQKPWYDDTLFVIVADHCAGSAGKHALPVEEYHIPLLFFAPKWVNAETNTVLSSQIDLAPTLLAILSMDYHSEFFGRNLLGEEARLYPRALIGNYQQLGLLTPDKLIYIQPVKEAFSENFTLKGTGRESDDVVSEVAPGSEQLNRLIAYYQAADFLYQHQLFNQAKDIAQQTLISKSLAKH